MGPPDPAAERTASPRDAPTLPSMFVVGFPKAGTTTVHRLLTDAGAAGATVKEPSVLLVDHGGVEPTARAYDRYYPDHDGQSPALDASPYYIYDPVALDRLAALDCATHILVAVREPWDRLRSQYLDQATQGFERRALADALRDELHSPTRHPTPRQLSRLYLASSAYQGPIERLLASPLAPLVRIVAAESLDVAQTRDAMSAFTGLPISGDAVRANTARTSTSMAPMLVAKTSQGIGALLPRWIHRRIAPMAKPLLAKASTLPIPTRATAAAEVDDALRAEVEAHLRPGSAWLAELPTDRWLGPRPDWLSR